MIRQQGRRYELRLETPSISFEPQPVPPGEPTQEQAYHAEAARRFHELLVPLEGTLDDAIEALLPAHPDAALLLFDERLPLVHDHDRARASGGACRFSETVDCPPDLYSIGFDHGTLTLAFAKLPEGGERQHLFGAIIGAIWTILREHHTRQREARRRGPAPSQPARFHYTRAADGTIEDLNGEAPGRRLAAERLAAPAALELCAAIAAIVAAAERDGVVHADLDASDVRVDGAEPSAEMSAAVSAAVSIDGFGELDSATEGHPPEGTASLFAPPGPRIDWIARQRYSLGYTMFQVLTGRALDAPRAPAADHDAAVARALVDLEPAALRDLLAKLLAWAPARRPSARDAWAVLAALIEPAPAPPDRRGASKIPARLAADTRGILDSCWTCRRPALRHAGRSIRTADGYRPDCCWWERDRRALRLGGAILFAVIAALLAWWLR